jgi:hypothetical protein
MATLNNPSNGKLFGNQVSSSASAADQVLTASSSTSSSWSYPNPAKARIASQAAGDILYADTTTTWARLGKGSDGQVLTLASGVPSWAAPSGGSSTPRSGISFTYQVPDASISTYFTTATTAGGSFVRSANKLRLSLDGTSNASAQLYYASPGLTSPSGMKNIVGTASLSLGIGSGDGNIYVRFFSSDSDPTNGAARQMGIKFAKAAGTVTVYASSGDGTTEQTTSLSGVTVTASTVNVFTAVESSTDVKFYVNGTLKATHSTNVPANGGTDRRFLSGLYTKDSASSNAYNLDITFMGLTWDIT